ncbi:MAG: hypothetical protein R3F31_28615, partial [Verrucomicrobiales bacterium]
MKKIAVILLLCLINHPLHGALLDDFETTNVLAIATRIGPAPEAQVQTNITATSTNRFLRLIYDEVGSQNNHYTYDRTDTGAWENITAAFDFRLSSLTNGLAADGISIAFIPTATYGISGDGPAYPAEEPNFAGVLAFAIDAHPAATVNDFSLHWNGNELVNQTAPLSQVNIDDGIFHRVVLEIERLGNSSLARAYVITNSMAAPGPRTLLFETLIPGMLPYENRVQLVGRSGGSTMDADVDNLSVTYSNLYTNIAPTITTNRLYQDFDSSGSSIVVSRQHSVTG